MRPSSRYLLYVITSPVGAYYAAGVKPVKIWVETIGRSRRQGRHRLGEGGRQLRGQHAHGQRSPRARVRTGALARRDRARYVEEVGTMNLFVVIGDELATPPLAGSILPGITRDTVLTLASDWGLGVVERPIAFEELVEATAPGRCAKYSGAARRRSSRPSASWATRAARCASTTARRARWRSGSTRRSRRSSTARRRTRTAGCGSVTRRATGSGLRTTGPVDGPPRPPSSRARCQPARRGLADLRRGSSGCRAGR